MVYVVYVGDLGESTILLLFAVDVVSAFCVSLKFICCIRVILFAFTFI